MASFGQHIYAALSPNVAVNSSGELVHASGLFDSGEKSTDYLNDEQVDYISENWFTMPLSFNFANSADGVSDQDQLVSELRDDVINSIENQNTNAQTSADRAMEFSAEQAQLNRDFQERMSNTAYQRAMADLNAAGINPKLVAKLGGASTPAGSSASGTAANMQAANFAPVASLLGSYITSAASLDNKDKDFIQNILTSIVRIMPFMMA